MLETLQDLLVHFGERIRGDEELVSSVSSFFASSENVAALAVGTDSVPPSLFASVVGTYLSFFARGGETTASASAKSGILRAVARLVLAEYGEHEKNVKAKDALGALLKSEAVVSRTQEVVPVNELGEILANLIERVLAITATGAIEKVAQRDVTLAGLLMTFRGEFEKALSETSC